MSLDNLHQQKLTEARKILQDLGFGPRQSNDIACYTLLPLPICGQKMDGIEQPLRYVGSRTLWISSRNIMV